MNGEEEEKQIKFIEEKIQAQIENIKKYLIKFELSQEVEKKKKIFNSILKLQADAEKTVNLL